MCKNTFFLLFFILSGSLKAQIIFTDYFESKSMRVDVVLAGNDSSLHIFSKSISQEPQWGGSKTQLLNAFEYGEFRYQILDKASNKVLFIQGFSTLFSEWQTTAEAHGINRAFNECVTFPYPKKPVILVIEQRQRNQALLKVFSITIDPTDKKINKDLKNSYSIKKILDSGDPANCIDLVFVAEGYTADQMPNFQKTTERFVSYLFTFEPYKRYQNKFNVWTVESISAETGVDNPGKNYWVSTPCESSFYTFDVDRYLTVNDFSKVRDVVSNVSSDVICIIANTSEYGGGGVYNRFIIASADNTYSLPVFIHELGHSFAGLADEYYDAETGYEDFYNLKAEPWEPNITTLVNFNSKWKNMVDSGVPVPTPRIKEYANSVGVFEGGAYVRKGIYSPMMDCRMKTNEAKGFCEVCQSAIEKMILYYCK